MQNYKNLVPLLILALGACRATSSEWSCRNLDSKVGCANISKADDAYLENGKATPAPQIPISQIPVSKSAIYSSSSDDINLGQTKLIRSQEKIGRIWIAPFMDGKGNYHEGSFIRVVDETSRWEKIITDDKTPIPTEISVINPANDTQITSSKEDVDVDLDYEEMVNSNQQKSKSSKSSIPVSKPNEVKP